MSEVSYVCRAHYRDVDKNCSSASEEDLVVWIPGRILLAALKDHELGQYAIDSVFKSGLLPPSTSPAVAAKAWASLYLHCNLQVTINLDEKSSNAEIYLGHRLKRYCLIVGPG